MKNTSKTNRRNFIKNSAIATAGLLSANMLGSVQTEPFSANEDSIYLIGPQDGFSPQIGTLLSTMTMMRKWVIDTVKGLTQEQLDFQIDDKSNSVGAMLLHLAATEKYYQLNTFDEMQWGSWNDDIKKEWDIPMGLGEEGRKHIKGHNIDYYLNKLEEVRNNTIKEFAKRDDEWIMKSEPFFENKPTNNYCKWFHVCEHESNHRGQMKLIISRLPEK